MPCKSPGTGVGAESLLPEGRDFRGLGFEVLDLDLGFRENSGPKPVRRN